MSSLSSSLATYGRIQTGFSTIMTVLVALCMVSVGVIMIRSSKSQRSFVAAIATLKAVQCRSLGKNSVTCDATATYAGPGGVMYTAPVSLNKRYGENASVTVYYDPANPLTVQVGAPLPPWSGYAVIACAGAIVAGSLWWAKAVQKSNSLAAYSGASSAFGSVTSLF